MATARPTPERSPDQRMEALAKANAVRSYRADLKQGLKAGHVSIIDLLTDPPDKIDTMSVVELLMAVPRFGRSKVTRLLTACRISPSKTIGGMSHRQRTEIVALLKRRL